MIQEIGNTNFLEKAPHGLDLKKESLKKGIEICSKRPELQSIIKKHGDADGLLIAEWALETSNEKKELHRS